MLDVFDFIADKGGDPKTVKESQRRRHAPPEAVDEVIALYEEARKTKYAATQAKQQINALQKEIGQKKKVSSSWLCKYSAVVSLANNGRSLRLKRMRMICSTKRRIWMKSRRKWRP